jgi:GNAT superfamily N-acetyltransferase
MVLGPEHVGRRVVVRRAIPGDRGPSGRPALTDVLGVLELFGDQTLVVRRDDGQVVEVARSRVVAAKPVPPRAGAPPGLRIAPEALQVVCAAGWQAPVRQPLGDWLLRAAGGFTGRANSVLAVGDPGEPLDTALEIVGGFYARAGLPTMAQVVVGSDIAGELKARGWVEARAGQADTVVQVAALSAVPAGGGAAAAGAVPHAGRREARLTDKPEVRLTDRVSDDWLLRYSRSAGTDLSVARSVLESAQVVTFARIADPPVAIGRAVLTSGWLGLSAVEVDTGLRRQGLGSVVVEALLAWGRSRGARWAYLQAHADNDAALALYARYGFRTHHRYRYLSAPQA